MASSRFLILALGGLACGCAAVPPQPSPSVCPPVASYTKEEEAQIFQELMKLPGDNILQRVADEDYHLRAALKACRG